MSTESPNGGTSGTSTGRMLLILVGVIVVLFVAALMAYNALVADRPSRSVRTTSPTAIKTLLLGSGQGDEVSKDFEVPVGCSRQVLSYSGQRIDNDQDVAWVNFRVRDAQGNPADSAIGPEDLLQSEEGSGSWSLGRGTYYVETESWNADWSYKVECR